MFLLYHKSCHPVEKWEDGGVVEMVETGLRELENWPDVPVKGPHGQGGQQGPFDVA